MGRGIWNYVDDVNDDWNYLRSFCCYDARKRWVGKRMRLNLNGGAMKDTFLALSPSDLDPFVAKDGGG